MTINISTFRQETGWQMAKYVFGPGDEVSGQNTMKTLECEE
jgi:hypothetical protein